MKILEIKYKKIFKFLNLSLKPSNLFYNSSIHPTYMFFSFFLIFSPCIIILFRKEREKKIKQQKNNFTMYLMLTSQNVNNDSHYVTY
jgi:hypothetical protein